MRKLLISFFSRRVSQIFVYFYIIFTFPIILLKFLRFLNFPNFSKFPKFQKFCKSSQRFSEIPRKSQRFPENPRDSQRFPEFQQFPQFLEFPKFPMSLKYPKSKTFPNFFHISIHDYASPGLNLFNLVNDTYLHLKSVKNNNNHGSYWKKYHITHDQANSWID